MVGINYFSVEWTETDGPTDATAGLGGAPYGVKAMVNGYVSLEKHFQIVYFSLLSNVKTRNRQYWTAFQI